MKRAFTKMHGAGNDFVVFDARNLPLMLTANAIRGIASRDNRITQGCDQVIVMEPSQRADVFMRIYNADGSEVDACGNATRCVADRLEKELKRLPVTIETNAALLQGIKKAVYDGQEYTLVDMGEPRFEWERIPLAQSVDTLHVPIATGMAGMDEAVCVSMGNPHAVIFVAQLPDDDTVERIGSRLEQDKALFPQGVNVTFAVLGSQVGNPHAASLDAKVWERGAGRTKSCGTAACATLVAAIRKGITSCREGAVWFETFGHRAMLSVTWQEEDNHVLLGGPVTVEFEREVEL